MATEHYHSFELIEYPFTNEFIQIDTELGPLMKKIWSYGIETIGCCQELIEGTPYHKLIGPGYLWIHFKTTEDFDKFTKVISEFFPKMIDHKRIGKHVYIKLIKN